jgi:pyroglutamyl-peptidase
MRSFTPRILVTGFEPFDGADDNPSARVADALKDGVTIFSEVLPVSAARLPLALAGAIDRIRPDVVLGLGEARGATAVRVEQIAINRLNFRTPDNDGVCLTETVILLGGPVAYLTTLPVAEMLNAIRVTGAACERSNDAGSYICNQMMYLAIHWAAAQPSSRQAGFIHLPSMPTQNTGGAGIYTIDLGMQVRAVRAALDVITRAAG